MFRLYHVPLSPFCRKVRLSRAEKKIEVELIEERYWDKSADFLRRNPAGKLPVLKIDDEINIGNKIDIDREDLKLVDKEEFGELIEKYKKDPTLLR